MKNCGECGGGNGKRQPRTRRRGKGGPTPSRGRRNLRSPTGDALKGGWVGEPRTPEAGARGRPRRSANQAFHIHEHGDVYMKPSNHISGRASEASENLTQGLRGSRGQGEASEASRASASPCPSDAEGKVSGVETATAGSTRHSRHEARSRGRGARLAPASERRGERARWRQPIKKTA